ncbi:hypothetical protein AB4865_05835 [Capnocytophaga sp. ARDL2]|uniref:hypothetical protein n=1 Tax=Capnocytophaga sp. ARDL2 TaxID=3238809 RepID=UPI003558602E
MKKNILILLYVLCFNCTNSYRSDKEIFINQLNKLLQTEFKVNENRIGFETEQDFSSQTTTLIIPLSNEEAQSILYANLKKFTYYENKIDSLVYKGYHYSITNDENFNRESVHINFSKDNPMLVYIVHFQK